MNSFYRNMMATEFTAKATEYASQAALVAVGRRSTPVNIGAKCANVEAMLSVVGSRILEERDGDPRPAVLSTLHGDMADLEYALSVFAPLHIAACA